MNEYLIARLYTDAHVQRLFAGTSKVMKAVIWRLEILKAAGQSIFFGMFLVEYRHSSYNPPKEKS